MKKGDLVFFYHSNCKVPGIVGIMKIAKESYVDDTAFDPKQKYYDPKSSPENPRWFRVDVTYQKTFKRTIPLSELRENPLLENMALLRKGNRLSIMPVSADEWQAILDMA
jgi:predicted RNA-binding protein with PUA-like domain